MMIKNKNAKYKMEESQSLYNNQNGFTLVEMLLAVTISLIVMGGTYEVFTSQQKAFNIQGQVAEMQQNARVALDMMTREIRMAGYIGEDWDDNSTTKVPSSDVAGQAWTDGGAEDIEENGVNAITFEADIDGNGQTDTVRYAIDGSNNLTREVWVWDGTSAWTGGGSQPLAENITTLSFTYLNSSGAVTATASSIRLIQIQLVARTTRQDSAYTHPANANGFRTRTLTANVRPRNLGL